MWVKQDRQTAILYTEDERKDKGLTEVICFEFVFKHHLKKNNVIEN